MRKLTDGEIFDKEWRDKRIKNAIQAYNELSPKARKDKQPDLEASSTGMIKIFIRNKAGILIAIFGETTNKFWKLTPEKIKKHSITINQRR